MLYELNVTIQYVNGLVRSSTPRLFDNFPSAQDAATEMRDALGIMANVNNWDISITHGKAQSAEAIVESGVLMHLCLDDGGDLDDRDIDQDIRVLLATRRD